jgi:uncharacterized glyoxalase superfamily protein PhnB
MSTDQTPLPEGGANAAEREPFFASALSASLTVKDVHASLAWYHDVLGFTVTRKFDRDGTLRAVSLAAGAARILLGQDDGSKGSDRVKGEGFSLRFTTAQNVDEIAARITSVGGSLETAPFDAWGARAFRVRDPDGFLLVISTEGQPT